MLVLGINDSHDASVCLMRDGKILIAMSEERPQRIKSMGGFPHHAIRMCLKETGFSAKDIDHVAIASEKLVPNNIHNLGATLSVRDYFKWEEEYYYPRLYENRATMLRDVFPDYRPKGDLIYPLAEVPFITTNETQGGELEKISALRLAFTAKFLGIDPARIGFYRHHRCHAVYGYYVAPRKYDRMVVVTSDAGGDGAYTSIHTVNGGRFETLLESRQSLIGKIYSAVTLVLGMRPNEHEYKVMGLAPYASEYHKAGPREIFLNALKVDGIDFVKDPAMKDHFFYFKERLRAFRFDGIAGGLQDFVERRLGEWFENIIAKTGIGDVVFSGGVANNVKANKRLTELAGVKSFFVPAGPGDENLSIGAAYAALYDKLGPGRLREMAVAPGNAYWGNAVDAADRAVFAKDPFISGNFKKGPVGDFTHVAEVLAQGEIVAVLSGRMEFGSRALGHRSLIADPSNPDSVRKINDLIKKRDFWMPFTPSILDERYDDYIVNPKRIESSYMTLCFDTTPLGKKHLKGAVHPYDYTARPQRVTQDTCPRYHALIKAFERRTGIGAVLNTSLNIHGKPIVMNPTNLLREILKDGDIPLKYILIEDTFYVRNDA